MLRLQRSLFFAGGLLLAALAVAQPAPVVSQPVTAQKLVAGDVAVTLNLQNYFAVPGYTPEATSGITLFPTGGGPSVVTFTMQNSSATAVAATLSGSTLTLDPRAGGAATVTVRAVTTGGTAEAQVPITVGTTPPVFTAQPSGQAAARGGTVVFAASAEFATTYRWQRDGTPVPGADVATLVLRNVDASDAGSYTCVATNTFGSVTSDAVPLTISEVAALDEGRLINLSVRAVASESNVLIMGVVTSSFNTSAPLPVVMRAVGPTLAQAPYNVPGVLGDPQMAIYRAGESVPFATNDNWGGSSAFASVFGRIGAFALLPNSADSAIVNTAPGLPAGVYTMHVTGKGSASGEVLAEIYDASDASRTTGSPHFVNLSVRKAIAPGGVLIAGFVVGGSSSRTILIRGIGPALSVAPFNIADTMPDPQLKLYRGTEVVAENDNWGGANHFRAIGDLVGAFSVENSVSRDAMLLVTVNPGQYTVHLSDAGGRGGEALVEVYEVP